MAANDQSRRGCWAHHDPTWAVWLLCTLGAIAGSNTMVVSQYPFTYSFMYYKAYIFLMYGDETYYSKD